MRGLRQKAEALSSGVVTGFRARDGRFDFDDAGPRWLAFEEPRDTVFWHPTSGQLATWEGRAFALNEIAIANAATYSLDGALIIRHSMTSWLRAGGNGILVLDWSRAFDTLRHAPRIVVEEPVRSTYHRFMRAAHMPKVFVLSDQSRD